MDRVEKLKRELSRTAPLHDTPLGLIHPYWARKPYNVVSIIIRHLSEPSDIVADPFAGSGTTVFAALQSNRNVIAFDLNPLSILIIQSILDINADPDEAMDALRTFCRDLRRTALRWFEGQDSWIVERERFRVEGEYAKGRLTLRPGEYVLRRQAGGGGG